jgi:hypothetical protein
LGRTSPSSVCSSISPANSSSCSPKGSSHCIPPQQQHTKVSFSITKDQILRRVGGRNPSRKIKMHIIVYLLFIFISGSSVAQAGRPPHIRERERQRGDAPMHCPSPQAATATASPTPPPTIVPSRLMLMVAFALVQAKHRHHRVRAREFDPSPLLQPQPARRCCFPFLRPLTFWGLGECRHLPFHAAGPQPPARPSPQAVLIRWLSCGAGSRPPEVGHRTALLAWRLSRLLHLGKAIATRLLSLARQRAAPYGRCKRSERCS